MRIFAKASQIWPIPQGWLNRFRSTQRFDPCSFQSCKKWLCPSSEMTEWSQGEILSPTSMNSRVAESRDFSPTAIALGSSAIVKVSGQNCFRTLYGFLGADPSWAARSFCGRFHKGFTKVEGCASFGISLVFWGRSVGVSKGSVEGSPITSLSLSPSSSTIFCIFPQQRQLWGLQPIVKCLGAKWHVCLLRFFAANGFRLPKGSLECSPNSSLHWSHSLLRFFGQMAVAWEGSVEGSAKHSLHLSPKRLLLHKNVVGWFRQLCFTCISQSPPGVKVAWSVDASHPYKSSPQKTTHHVVAVGVFFGLISPKMLGLQCSNLCWVLLTAWFFRVSLERWLGRTWWHRDFWIRKVGGVCLCGLCSPSCLKTRPYDGGDWGNRTGHCTVADWCGKLG